MTMQKAVRNKGRKTRILDFTPEQDVANVRARLREALR